MRKSNRYEALSLLGKSPFRTLPIASALRSTLRAGYHARDLKADLMAGVVIGIVALPLSMALAIASGVPPQHGLYTAIVAGFTAAALGGARTSVTGPTAAFVVLLTPVSAKYGVGGLVLASLMAGAMLVTMGALRLGRLIQFIPYPVTTGFTSGIAVVIATLQFKDFFGLTLPGAPEHYWERVAQLAEGFGTLRWQDMAVGFLTLGVLIGWKRINRGIPAPLAAIIAAAVGAWAVAHWFPDFSVSTIGSRFSFPKADGSVGMGIPSLPPLPQWPWAWPGADGGALVVNVELFKSLLGPAFAIAMLGAIESLLCAVVADGMAGTRHDPDSELVGQGVGNMVAACFGGFAATGAIARTATNIRSGGRTPIAAMTHALVVLAAVLVLGSLMAYLPLAALAALLLVVAWNMSEVRHFVHVVKVAPRSDVVVLLLCFSLTVLFDMVIAVGVGVVLAALLFMRRMSDLTSTSLVDRGKRPDVADFPASVLFYEIAGPLFFGAASKAAESLHAASKDAKVVVLHMAAVPVMDVTGLVALESAIKKLGTSGAYVVLAGVNPQPAALLRKSGLQEAPGKLAICATLVEAKALVGATPRETFDVSPEPLPVKS